MKTTTKKTISKTISYSDRNLFEIISARVRAGNNGATVIVPHVCNNADAFGAGFASHVSEKYPIVKENYHMLGKNFLKQNFGYCQIVQVYEDPKYKHKLIFANMIAQNGFKNQNNPRPINYLALVKSMNSLSQYITLKTGFVSKNENIEIHCPKFGSGLAGGDWNFIANLIEDIWPKYFITVYNYRSN